MSVYRDKDRGRWVFEFSRRIDGRRVRTRKLLPPSWTRTQADAYDRQQSASLYATASGAGSADPPIDLAITAYLKERAPELKNCAVVEQNLALVRWAYKGKTMAQLPEVCQAITKKWRAELAPATIRNRIRYLTAACRYGWKKHGIGEHDPAARVVVPAVKNERRVFIDRRQMLAVAKACSHKPTRAAIRIAFYSGMRISEVIRADRVVGAFVLHDTKNGQPRIVPMHPRLRCCAHIRQVEASATSEYFRIARDAAGMPWLHFHDLRHSAASELINSGVDLYTVGAVLGHKSSQSTKRYAHLATDTLRDAIGRIGQKFTHQGKKRTS